MKKLVIAFLIFIFSNILNAVIPERYIHLPSPYKPNCILEDAIARRKSIREFTKDEISLENLSAILWAAYNIESVKNAVKTYVLMKDGIYVYIPSKHSLKLYRKGDFG